MFWTTSDALDLYTDSTGNSMLGCGAYFNGHWVQFQLPKNWAELDILADITCLGLVPIVLAFYIWGPNFRNKKTLLRIDNQALVYIINKRTSKSKRVMVLLRKLVFLTMYNNIQFKANHIEGSHNEIADSLSRFQEHRIRSMAPNADLLPADIPQEFLNMILELK